MADTTVTNTEDNKGGSLVSKTTSAITDIRRLLNEPAAKRALPTAVALIVTFIGILLFISMREPAKTTLFSSNFLLLQVYFLVLGKTYYHFECFHLQLCVFYLYHRC